MKRKVAALIADSTFIILLAFGLIFLLGQCGCVSYAQKLRSKTNQHELKEQRKGIRAGDMDEVARRNARMQQLEDTAENTYGTVTDKVDDNTLPLAIYHMQNDTLFRIGRMALGAITGYAGVGDWWKEILASGVTLALGAYAVYERKKRKVAENGTSPPPKKKNG